MTDKNKPNGRSLRDLLPFRTKQTPGASTADVVNLAQKLGFNVGLDPNGVPVALPPNTRPSENLSNFNAAWGQLLNQGGVQAERSVRFRSYEEMDASGGEGSIILDTYTDECLNVMNPGDKSVFIDIQGPDSEMIESIKEVIRRAGILDNARADVRSIAKYGDLCYVIDPITGESLNQAGLDVAASDQGSIRPGQALTPSQFRVYPIASPMYDLAGVDGVVYKMVATQYANNNRSATGRKMDRTYEPWEFSCMSIEDRDCFPYGRSVLEAARIPWEQLASVEQLLALTRANSVDRINVSVPMETTDPSSGMNKLMNIVGSIKSMMMGAVMPSGSGYGQKAVMTRPRDMGFTDYLFTPSGFEVKKLGTSVGMATIEDVTYFRDKVITSSKIPKSHFIADGTNARPGTLRQQDVRFSRALIPLGKAYCRGLSKLIILIGFYLGADISKMSVDVSLRGNTFVSKDFLDNIRDMIQIVKDFVSLRQAIDENYVPDKDDIKNILSVVDAPVELLYKNEDADGVKKVNTALMEGNVAYLVEVTKNKTVCSYRNTGPSSLYEACRL